ncbi:MAG: Hpt domain-containing protein [Candidatus Melainabacteria bacterium]|jgi:two-component system chemotaxis sensor kinase CheA
MAQEEYLDLFFDEVGSNLENLSLLIGDLEKNPSDPKIINEIFRIVHTIKGMSATIGFNSLSRLCHKMEELFDYYRQNPQSVSEKVIQVEVKATDALFKILDYLLVNPEESTVCTVLSEALSHELEDLLKSLCNPKSAKKETKEIASPLNKQANAKELPRNQTDSIKKNEDKVPPKNDISSSISSSRTQGVVKELQIKVKFADDCPMLGVRAFMATQALEKQGEIIESLPTPDKILDDHNLALTGLTAIIRSAQDIEKIKERLLNVCDIIEVEVTEKAFLEQVKEDIDSKKLDSLDCTDLIDKEDLVNRYSEKSERVDSSLDAISHFPENFIDLLSSNEKALLVRDELKAFKVFISLSEEVENPEEQFLNLVNNLNDYLGHVVFSTPSQIELRENMGENIAPREIFDLISSEVNSSGSLKERFILRFIVLLKGSHKNILDFLCDACELNKVEVKEMDFDLPDIPSAFVTETNDLQNVSGIIENTNKKAANEEENDYKEQSQVQDNKTQDVKTSFVRVNMATLESLMNAVGELVINHNKMRLTIGKSINIETRSTIQYLHQITTQIQHLVTGIRMVAINQVFNRFPRFIRDISRQLQKDVTLEIIGEETEIDRLMVDDLNDIFTHLVRNSIDHGIETAEEREKNGKKRKGTIRMEASSQGNQVFLTIADDGKGMDPSAIKRKAIQKNIISPEEADLLSEQELLNLIFLPGFSTTEAVSDLSGRGVGMDVVKSKIQSLGGQVSMSSVCGEGTSIKLSIPSTISIIQALVVENIRKELYAIPIPEIKEICHLNLQKELFMLGSCAAILIREQIIPLINLDEYLNSYYLSLYEREEINMDEVEEAEEANDILPIADFKECYIVIIDNEGKPYGLVVSGLLGQQEIVIKPISNRVNKGSLVHGASVVSDGRVSMVINIGQVVNLYLKDSPRLSELEIKGNLSKIKPIGI